MGLLSNLRGNATEIDIAKVQAELEPVLVPGESIGRGFKIFRYKFGFPTRTHADHEGADWVEGDRSSSAYKTYLAHCVFGGSLNDD